MSKHIDTALDSDVDALDVLWMSEDRHSALMRLLNRSPGNRQRQNRNFPIALVGRNL